MVVKGNNKRLIIGSWVLAALLILWYNATAMTSLLDKPLPGLSPEARSTIAKYQRLENHIASRLKEMIDPRKMEDIFARIDDIRAKVLPAAKKSGPVPATVKKPKPVRKKDVALPSLNGIVAVYDAGGAVAYLAVMDGKTREEKSSIGGFRIEKIDAKGVLLAQGKENWFLPAPTVDFSMDTSMEE